MVAELVREGDGVGDGEGDGDGSTTASSLADTTLFSVLIRNDLKQSS